MKSHEWATLDGNIATVGISDYAQVWRGWNTTPYKLMGHSSCTGMARVKYARYKLMCFSWVLAASLWRCCCCVQCTVTALCVAIKVLPDVRRKCVFKPVMPSNGPSFLRSSFPPPVYGVHFQKHTQCVHHPWTCSCYFFINCTFTFNLNILPT